MTIDTDFKIGDEVLITLPEGDMLYESYHGKTGLITRIEEPDEHYTGMAGYYVNCAGMSVLRAHLGEIEHHVPVPDVEEPADNQRPVDVIRKDLADALTNTNREAFMDNATAYVAHLLAVIDAIEAECRVSEAHAAQFNDDPKVYTEHIRQIIGSTP